MKTLKQYNVLVAAVIIYFVIVGFIFFSTFKHQLNNSFFFATVTFFVGVIAVYLYIKQKIDSKRDAARIIIQEIRRAEEIISRYREQGNFQFTQKIIANNSWGKNVHYFVGDLNQDELDKISNLYSTGEFLDIIIKKIFDWNFESASHQFEENIKPKKIRVPTGGAMAPSLPPFQPSATGVTGQAGFIEVEIPQAANEPFWNPLLRTIVQGHEAIYHSTIVYKLKKIAHIE